MESGIIFAVIYMVSVLLLAWIDKKSREHMQKTIDELTNKLMARDFKEYIAMSTPPVPEKPKQKKQSWYDTESEIEDMQ